ncbi:bifunctional 3,4-dihydroxy-2-butanone-4-phosphate synthase/GTP cyclohydrolase II [Fervidobacterium islandicum]|uniref:GTP cyclohydrolase-2 n=1 Tax=Fervidobacterium islandicum TaxID=2423 RepID=A0AAI8CKZ2_FERIS|nr:bifunctional 3,4-dihydroxy-2-butanone-4-phosphate synthase/GTP cyclohydrolase II [Fervidobacterium islandicum]AMW32509.1 bifunctional 3,4-dihydroxy-2-butanone-4-phosphate synthase/GTP cyclohydrolase II [Fervidobacterium islandicum]
MEQKLLESIRNDFLNNKPIIILDDEREVEGDLVFPAELMNESVAEFFFKYGKGLFCIVGPEENLLKRGFFKLPTNYNANYFIPIDFGNGTGINAFERAQTCVQLANTQTTLSDFRYPGHVTLIGAKDFTMRRGHSESSVELMKLSGFKPFSVITEILDENGESHNIEHVFQLAKKFGLKVLNISGIWRFYVKNTELMKVKSVARLPTRFGEFKIISFENNLDHKEHIALLKEWEKGTTPYVRVHSECLTGDTLLSLRCDCGSQLSNALRKISEKGGILLYLRQEGRGIGLSKKIEAYNLQDSGYDTHEANIALGFKPDERDYAAAYQMLKALGVEEVILLTNNKEKVDELEKYGIRIRHSERLYGEITRYNEFYLKTKLIKFHHQLEELFEKEV